METCVIRGTAQSPRPLEDRADVLQMYADDVFLQVFHFLSLVLASNRPLTLKFLDLSLCLQLQ